MYRDLLVERKVEEFVDLLNEERRGKKLKVKINTRYKKKEATIILHSCVEPTQERQNTLLPIKKGQIPFTAQGSAERNSNQRLLATNRGSLSPKSRNLAVIAPRRMADSRQHRWEPRSTVRARKLL